MDILNAATLQRPKNLGIARGTNARPRALVFSPDGRMLSSSGFDGWGGLLVSTWDLQTGGTASRVELPWRGPGSVYGDYYITYSANGKMVGVLHRFSSTAIISVVDVVSGKHTHDIHPCTPCTYDVWTHGESLRFATAEGVAITIWEVAFTPGATCMEIETLSVPDGVKQAEAFDREGRKTRFFPVPRRLVFTHASPAPEFRIPGARYERQLTSKDDLSIRSFVFSHAQPPGGSLPPEGVFQRLRTYNDWA